MFTSNPFQSTFFPMTTLAFVGGILTWGAFNWGLEVTNSEGFCISCHEMRENVYREYLATGHYQNRTGVRASCPNCHVPKEWLYMVVRKIRASNELFHWLKGSINTREKFVGKRLELAQLVWSAMAENDSRECRNCHDMEFMDQQIQTPMAVNVHDFGHAWDITCIECHKGIVHTLPAGFDGDAWLDPLHDRLKEAGVPCGNCHKGMAGPPHGNEWED